MPSRERPSWSSDTSRPCSPSPRRARSPPPPTRWRTVQSNVSDQVRQLEAELGVPLLVRSRRGAEPTEFGVLVLERARRVAARARGDARRPLAAAGARGRARAPRRRRHREPLAGARARRRPARARAGRAPARERGCVGAALRRGGRRRARAGGRHRAGQRPPARGRAPARRGRSSVSSATTSTLPREPVPLAVFAKLPLVLPPEPNPLRIEVDTRRRGRRASRSTVPVEVEGIRLIADLVVAGDYASILPETAIPPELTQRAHGAIAGLPPRRLAMVQRARRADVARRPGRPRQRAQPRRPSTWRRGSQPKKRVRSRTEAGMIGGPMAAQPVHDDGRKVNVKLILLGLLAAILVLFAILNTHEVGVDFVFNTWSTSLILVIADLGGDRVRDRLPREGTWPVVARTTDRAGLSVRYGRDRRAATGAGEDPRGDVADAEHEEAARPRRGSSGWRSPRSPSPS